MRLFIALDIPEEVKRKVEEIQGKLKKAEADVKWVEPQNLHFTLKFLGEVPEERVEEVKAAVKRAISGFSPFKLELKGVGYFGSKSFLRVIWISGKSQEAVKLMERLEEELKSFRPEEREKNLHLTLGRVRSGRGREELLKAISDLSETELGEFEVREVKLKESRLSPKGPQYRDIAVFSLPAGS